MKEKLIALFFLVAALAGCNKSQEITVIAREAGSGTRAAFTELLGITATDGEGRVVDATIQTADITNSTQVCIESVARNRNAIGYVSLGALPQGDAAATKGVKPLQVDAVAPTVANVQSGQYKVVRPFLLVVANQSNPAAQAFLAYVLDTRGQEIVAKMGYVPVSAEPIPQKFPSENSVLKITGSSSVFPLMEKLVESYQKDYPTQTVELSFNDSSSGIMAVKDGVVDIGMSSRTLKPAESALFSVEIARDAIAIIVNSENPTVSLSADEVKKIYTGVKKSWDFTIFSK